MELFQKKSALEREWQKALKQEKKFLEKGLRKRISIKSKVRSKSTKESRGNT